MNELKKMTRMLSLSLLALAIVVTVAQAQEPGRNSESADEVADIVLRVDGLACPFCAHGLKRKLEALNATDRVEVKLNEGEVYLFLKAGQTVEDEALTKAVTHAGFVVRSIRRSQADN